MRQEKIVEFNMAEMVEWAEKYHDSPEVNDVVGSDVLKSQMGLGWWSGELKDCVRLIFGKCGTIGMEAVLSDQSKAGVCKVEIVIAVGAKSVSWAWASALTSRGGGLVWDEEVWCEGEA